jgi:hypothetical protein
MRAASWQLILHGKKISMSVEMDLATYWKISTSAQKSIQLHLKGVFRANGHPKAKVLFYVHNNITRGTVFFLPYDSQPQISMQVGTNNSYIIIGSNCDKVLKKS